MTLNLMRMGVDSDGPAIAAAFDPVTGAYSRVWTNPSKLEDVPVLIGAVRPRVAQVANDFSTSAARDAVKLHYSDPTLAHAEILAVNELLWLRFSRGLPVDNLSGIVTRVISTKESKIRGTVWAAGSLFQHCQNCGAVLNEVWSISGRRHADVRFPWEG